MQSNNVISNQLTSHINWLSVNSLRTNTKQIVTHILSLCRTLILNTKVHYLVSWSCETYSGCFLTVSRFEASTSIIPRKRFWQSGGMKCGIWNTPRLTFSNSCRKLSSSNGRAPCRSTTEGDRKRGEWILSKKQWKKNTGKKRKHGLPNSLCDDAVVPA